MEATATWLIGVGGLCVSLSFLLGVVELATLRTIHPPERQTFTYIRLAATQYQTVFAPAMGALISGLFVSLAASFFYAGFTGQQDSWQRTAGIISFVAGAIALMATLWSALKDVGEPMELARDPFSIRAAADESTAAPQSAGLDPDLLSKQLDEWEASISARSMNLSARGTSDRLAETLTQAAQTRRFWFSAFRSLQVYYAAVLRFPFRFGWPLLGFAVFMIGILWFAIGLAELKFLTSWRPWAAVSVFAIVGAIATLFYCMTRGGRARLWHRINVVALKDARNAIGEAKRAHASVAAENILLQRILKNADKFLQQDLPAPAKAGRTVLRLGRFRLAKD